ncbi:hypothetical protein FSP39_019470, partial [Pinctada imbricata]
FTVMDIKEVNKLNRAEFVHYFRNVVNNNPLCAAVVWQQRPFSDVKQMHRCFEVFLDSLSVIGKLGVFCLSPDLGCKELFNNSLSKDSANEQTNAGLKDLTEEERRRMENLNVQYLQKFGFPFIKAVRKSNRLEILEALEKRIHNSRPIEIENALQEVKKYSWYRLQERMNYKSKL